MRQRSLIHEAKSKQEEVYFVWGEDASERVNQCLLHELLLGLAILFVFEFAIDNVQHGILSITAGAGFEFVLDGGIEGNALLCYGFFAPAKLQLRQVRRFGKFLIRRRAAKFGFKTPLYLLHPLMRLVEALRYLNDTRLDDLGAFHRASDPIHGIRREAKATFRVKFLSCADKGLPN